MIKKIAVNYFMFILPTIIVGILSIMEEQKTQTSDIFPKLQEILVNNFTILFLLVILGVIHRLLPYVLFLWNSIVFSIFVLIYGDFIGAVAKVFPYGLFEIMSLSIACYIGTNLKTLGRTNILKLSIIAIVFLLISAVIEIYSIKGAI